MLRTSSTLALFAVLALAGCDGGSGSTKQPPSPELAYPESVAGSESDTYFGRQVVDPYRWLEDIRSQDTENWIQAQNRFAAEYITALPDYGAISKRIAPWFAPAQTTRAQRARDTLRTKQDEVLHIEGERGTDGRLYYQRQVQQERHLMRQDRHHRRAPQTQPQLLSVDNVIYVASGQTASERDEALVDVDDFRVDPDDKIQLLGHQVSEDGRYLVYRMQRNFADLVELHVVDLQNPSVLLMRIPHVFSQEIALYNDGVIYSSPRGVEDDHVSPHTFQSLYYQPFDGARPQAWFEGQEFDMLSGSFLHEDQLYIIVGTNMQSGYLRLDPAHPELGVQPFIDRRTDQETFTYLGPSPEDSANMLFLTSQGADLYRLIEVDPADPAAANWREILPLAPQGETVYVNEVLVCGSDYYAEHLDLGSSRLFLYSAGGAREIPLPGLGAVSQMDCSQHEGQDILLYSYSSLSQPHIDYSYNPATHTATPGPVLEYEGYSPDPYEMSRSIVTSTGGAQIPVYIAHKKGLEPSGDVPVLIYSYGGFMTEIKPQFDMRVIPLLENGGIYAVAQVRGGAEFGFGWYEAGRLLTKQNTYNDVIAVAEHLVEEGWTSPGKIALLGESNGGTTTAAVALQRPDLFGVVFPWVGVHDLVRYDKFAVGFSWHGDYGRNTDQAEFNNLMMFSPLHNVKPINYPPIYIFTSKTDGRVMPAHSYKLAATLQNTATGTSPYLLYAFPKDDHGLSEHLQAALAFQWTAFFHHVGSPYVGSAN
ncbi:prolyl oligopeptidase family serine peptidase [Pusillimonas sp.]|uniref:prolyl oligopeptidase family serine peptidase n=1 Tax=Pusillimonas sp. TaxID=3040095 RepID=UPI0037C8791B